MDYKKKIWYPWLEKIYNQILHSYYIRQGHHTLLFNSKYNNGEDTLVYYVARWLLCKTPNSMQYCDVCCSCYLMNKESHPDYYKLSCKDHTKSIGIDSVRVCMDAIYQCNSYSTVKIIVIKYIEYLTEESINALLKILEEPPLNTYFFLITREYMNLPKTLLSRCIKWFVSPPSEESGLQWLMQNNSLNQDILSSRIALRLNYGSPIEAELMLQSSYWKYRIELYKIIYDAIENEDFLRILKPFHNKKYVNMFMSWLLTLLVDALKLKYGVRSKFIINLDQLELVSIITNRWDMSSLNNQLKQWFLLFVYFQKFDNINHELLLVYRLLNWQKNIVEICFESWSI